MSLFDYLLKEDTICVFDVDGVLSVYHFGERTHNACKNEDWEAYVLEQKPYSTARPVKQIQKFIKRKNLKNIYVCSLASKYEEEDKRNFITREYGIYPENIFFVREKEDKLKTLKKIAKDRNTDEPSIAMIEDTTDILDMIYNKSNFSTVHVSSFFLWDTFQ